MPLTTPSVPALVSPQLEDAALLVISGKLEAGLSWLGKAYGRVQLMVDERNGRQVQIPGIYIGGADGKQYMPGGLLPDTHKGNFSFFDLSDRQGITMFRPVRELLFTVGLVVWGDARTTYPADWQERNVVNVVSDVLDVLENMATPSINIVPTMYFYDATNIYNQRRYRLDSFTHNEIQTQFLMWPYFGFRIEMDIKYFNNC
jgi:hypothetical protein